MNDVHMTISIEICFVDTHADSTCESMVVTTREQAHSEIVLLGFTYCYLCLRYWYAFLLTFSLVVLR